MRVDTKQFFRAITVFILAMSVAIPQTLFAQTAQHVVGPAELNKAAVEASQARQQNLNTVKEFVSSQKAQQALKSARVNPEQVKRAVSGLSDGELARLASRVNKAQADFAAGRLSDRDLIIILIAIAALILIIVAVH
jgi:hypothetical protein